MFGFNPIEDRVLEKILIRNNILETLSFLTHRYLEEGKSKEFILGKINKILKNFYQLDKDEEEEVIERIKINLFSL